MRISDWSSDVCSSDLRQRKGDGERQAGEVRTAHAAIPAVFGTIPILARPGPFVTVPLGMVVWRHRQKKGGSRRHGAKALELSRGAAAAGRTSPADRSTAAQRAAPL